MIPFAPADAPARPLLPVAPDDLAGLIDRLPAAQRAWVTGQAFKAGAGDVLLLPGADGAPEAALLGRGTPQARARERMGQARAAARLPDGDWRLPPDHPELRETALGWLLESHRFAAYKPRPGATARLAAPPDAATILRLAEAECLTRDLIDTPACDMGAAEIAEAARSLAARHGATCEVTEGEALATGFPLIHAVGRAAATHRQPRLIDLRWGEAGPRLTLVGKGVAFDTGGLDIKPSASMLLMKKDMGGAATVLGLAHAIMAGGWPVRLRVLVPTVENCVGPDSMRPSDIVRSRKGLTVEINNTDAEGRLILADALAYAAEEGADALVSMATLTGAARVAVGPDLAPVFTDDDALAAALVAGGREWADPVWRLPFHEPYEPLIEPLLADLDNAPSGGMAGAITAALFLRRFARAEGVTRYAHFDIYGWTPVAAPGRPKGGAGQGARALHAALPGVLGIG